MYARPARSLQTSAPPGLVQLPSLRWDIGMYGLSISFLSEQPTSPPHATHPGPKLCHEIFLHFPFLKAQHWDKCMGSGLSSNLSPIVVSGSFQASGPVFIMLQRRNSSIIFTFLSLKAALQGPAYPFLRFLTQLPTCLTLRSLSPFTLA